jgi:GT2 family glycosyltransferase
MNADKPKLSLVTGTVNRPHEVRRLIASVLTHTKVDFELVIADASTEPVVWDDPRVRILPERPRLGYTKGHNMAFRQCRGEWVLYLNDDAEVCPGYAETAIAFMEANPHIGLGCLPYSNRGGPFVVNQYWNMIYANFGILRRSLGDALGWFNESIRMYGSDNALTFDVLLAGLGVAEIKGAHIIHHETDDANRSDNQIGRDRDGEILYEQYWPRLEEMRNTYDAKLTQTHR